MKNIFQKNLQLKAPGGKIYEWKSAETKFQVPKNGLYAIRIDALAKNAKQNNSTDDDDLKIALDGFDFGKYENHQEKVSWKGFGTSASWNGASLKGETKIIYYFVTLEKGEHILRFFVDNTPTLKGIASTKFTHRLAPYFQPHCSHYPFPPNKPLQPDASVPPIALGSAFSLVQHQTGTESNYHPASLQLITCTLLILQIYPFF